MQRNERLAVLGALGAGAAMMYYLDAEGGRRRRALARDRIKSTVNRGGDAVSTTARDLRNRSRGVAARARSRLRSEDDVGDEIIVDRVRSRLGRIVTYPRAITVTSHEGHVVLDGAVSADELDKLIAVVRTVPGVQSVDNQLTVHTTAEGVLADQSGRRVAGRGEGEAGETRLRPATRLLEGAAGAVLVLTAARRRGFGGPLLGIAGLGLLTRAATSRTERRRNGTGDSRDAAPIPAEEPAGG